MRTPQDRLRHTVLFEVIALLIAVPLFSAVSGHGMGETGVLALGLSLIAMVWNYGYNVLFDRLLSDKYQTQRSLKIRLLHALFFELGLLIIMLPIVAWWMQLSLIDALFMDIGFAVFFMAYAFVFNWAYDGIFPVAVAKAL